jgi:uncharacterized membrane protein YsdA (DUF1294 family)
MRPERPERNRNRPPSRGQFTWRSGAVLLVLLVVPGWALYRLGVQFGLGWMLAGWAVLSALTYLTYASDKRKAEAGEWRTPENTLHLLEFAGGWPAAFVAQRRLRHKISKGSYQFVFWAIIFVHQAAATDFLLDWKFARLALAKAGGDQHRPAAGNRLETVAPAASPQTFVPKTAPVATPSTPATGERRSDVQARPKRSGHAPSTRSRTIKERPDR